MSSGLAFNRKGPTHQPYQTQLTQVQSRNTKS